MIQIPSNNYEFANWVLDGDNIGNLTTIGVLLDSPYSLGARFIQKETQTDPDENNGGNEGGGNSPLVYNILIDPNGGRIEVDGL